MLDKNILNEFSNEDKYTKIYLNIIKKAKDENRCKGNGTYYEQHHILPKSIFPEFEYGYDWNLVLLTAREHYISHYLLWKIYFKMNEQIKMNKMVMGILAMQAVNHSQMRFNSRLFEKLKITYEHSDETKRKMSKLKKGKVAVKKNNKTFIVNKEVFDNDKTLVGHTVGFVSAKNINTGEHVFVSKSEFDSNDELVGVNKNIKRTDDFKINLSKKNRGSNSTTAKRINIYDDKHNLVLETFGNFETKCVEIGLPFRIFRKSYQNNTVICYKEGYSKTKAINSGNIKYQGWYAKIVNGEKSNGC